MSNSQKKSLPFKVSPRLIRMFGRQNVANPLVAIVELIKNAYDADASVVNVTFTNGSTSAGTIVISDDGCGMDEEALSTHWMTIGTDYKEREPISQGGRVRTGAKGIGRFALDRLGDIGILETFQEQNEEGLCLTIDWSQYDVSDKSFESVTHELISVPNAAKGHGTKITITNIRDRWTRDDYNSLYDDLVFLIPPLNDYNMSFSINLQIDECEDLSGPVKPLVRAEAEYELNSRIDSNGHIHHVLRHRSGEEVTKEVSWSQVDAQLRLTRQGPVCGPVEAKILFYLNESKQIKNFEYKQADLQRYLKTFRGVRIYRDGFQIKPYGSKGNDWLELDARKHASLGGVRGKIGAYRVNNRQIIGTVAVSRHLNPELEDRTNRDGLIENDAYLDLKKFLMNCISFLEVERQLYMERSAKSEETSLEEVVDNIAAAVESIEKSPIASEPDKQKSLDSAENDQKGDIFANESQNDLRASISDITASPHKGEKRIVDEKVVDSLRHSLDELEAQLKEIQLLRALATIGIALATFSHEIKNNVFSLASEVLSLKELVLMLPEEETKNEAQISLEKAYGAAQNIKNWSDFVLERTKRSRRVETVIDFEKLVAGVFWSFETSFEHYLITKETRIEENIPLFKAFPIDLESILINFISNSLKSLEGRNKRHIRCSATYDGTYNLLEIIFEDNGPGIDTENLPHPHAGIQQIFEPFVSGRHDDGKFNDGTGMGLAVVNRIIKDLKGSIKAEGHGELGGAKFTVRLPIKKVNN